MEVFGFGFSGPELLVLLLVILLVLGPQHIIQAARAFGKGINAFRNWSRRLRESSEGQLTQELNIDLKDLDLRSYDPRKMIREAVHDEMNAWMKQMDPTQKPKVPGLDVNKSRAEKSTTDPDNKDA